ncbi:MAG TPA: Gldg family protein, partial [Pseudomonadales bacterium]|nr:Gldg family protein [Pseudomonadales bacterium]
MNKKIYSGTGLILLAIAFLVFTLFNNLVLSGVKLDLTQGHLYTLSKGTKNILDSIDEPINLYLFFSNKTSRDLAGLRAYQQRVKELLDQYVSLSRGKIKLHVIDPEPFSEEEDRATSFGLQSVPAGNGDKVFFGLAGTNALNDHEVIPFFQPDKEQFLEYDISRMVQALSVKHKPVVGLMSSLKVQGNVDMKTFRTTPPWIILNDLHKEFDVHNIEMTATSIPNDVNLLVIIHPKDLSEETQFAIDQFVMKGGHVLAFVDPLPEQDQPQQNGIMAHSQIQPSDMHKLLASWGVKLRDGVIVGDSDAALRVRSGNGGQTIRHLAILGLDKNDISANDVVTASLKNINVSSAGILDTEKDATTHVEPLLQSSRYAMPIATPELQYMTNPEELEKGFKPTGKRYTIAARITGTASSAFPKGIKGHEKDVVSRTEKLDVIVVADTDILTDRLWVQVQNFFGQRIASPFANNGDFVINAVDNLLGSSDLISVRSRGHFTRPFTVVQELRRKADAKYQQSADDLQAKLSDTESKLQKLQAEKTKNNVLTLSPGQQAALEKFQKEKLDIRRQLREVRHQLDKDI